MLFDFFKESLSFYVYENDVFPVKITDIKDEVETVEEDYSGRPSYYLVGHRIDNPTFVVTIVHPFRYSLPIFIGDFVLVRKLSTGFYLLLGKLNEKIKIDSGTDTILALDNPAHRSVLPQLFGKGVFGTVYNENAIYFTYVSSYIKKEQNYLRKRFIEFPSYDVYRSFYDIFQYEEKLWDILNDKNEDIASREAIFSMSLSPTNKEGFFERNSTAGFPFRPDVVFDANLSDNSVHKDEAILKRDKKILFSETIQLQDTDKYPYIFFFDEQNTYKFVSYDEILKSSDDIYDYQIFYPFEYRETRLGRNKLGFYRFSKEDTFATFKSEFDQQISFLKSYNNYQTRIRNKQNTILIEETENFSRMYLNSYHSSFLEMLSKHNTFSYVFGIVADKQSLKNLQKQGTKLSSKYSFILLRNKQITGLSRVPQEYSDGVYSVILQAKNESENSIVYLNLNSSSFSSIKAKVGSSRYVEIIATNEDTCFIVKNSLGNHMKFCRDNLEIKEDLKVKRNAIVEQNVQILGNETINGNSTISGSLTVGGNETINGNSTISGSLTVGGGIISSSLTVGGRTTFSSLTVEGGITSSSLTVGGGITSSSLTVSGSATIGGKQVACFAGTIVVPC